MANAICQRHRFTSSLHPPHPALPLPVLHDYLRKQSWVISQSLARPLSCMVWIESNVYRPDVERPSNLNDCMHSGLNAADVDAVRTADIEQPHLLIVEVLNAVAVSRPARCWLDVDVEMLDIRNRLRERPNGIDGERSALCADPRVFIFATAKSDKYLKVQYACEFPTHGDALSKLF